MKVLLVAGTRSGDGKTTFAVGLMGALRQRGLVVQAFKVGPDQLDPLLHEAATGRPSYNLDGWLRSRENNTRRVAQIATSAGDDVDIAIIEGGETLFDADDSCLSGETGSAAEIAKWLGAPVLLIVDCSTQSARGAAATVRGHVTFDEHLTIAGVILNKTEDEAHELKVREAIAAATPNVPVLGALRRPRH
jgi:cobyrinic acid a,c-diamide synthase